MEMDTALAVAEAEQSGVDDIELVALSPSDLLAAQTNLVNWCDGKVRTIRTELDDLRDNLRIAKESKWRWQGYASAISRAEKRILFYEKIKAAVGAGYLIVPNFPVDLLAVRVKRSKQREVVSDYQSGAAFDAKAELLPAGDGRYVDNRLMTTSEQYQGKSYDGTKEVTKTRYRSDDYAEVDFPVQAVKPVILDATRRAMSLKIFDEMGIVQNRSGRDPIIVGRLLDPRQTGRVVTFFVAWWLNTSTL
jgi:hypothetical protein